MNGSVEDMEREIKELADRFWYEDINLSEEVKKIRAKYSKGVRKRFSLRNPSDPNLMRVFATIVSLPDQRSNWEHENSPETYRLLTEARGYFLLPGVIKKRRPELV